MYRDNGKIVSDIRLNASHEIFKGHFPNQAVVPGVCMLQMQREIMEEGLGCSLIMKEASMIKFLTMMVPDQFDSATFHMDITETEQGISVVSSLIRDETVFLKFKGTFVKA